MPRRRTRPTVTRRIRAVILQPLLTFAAKRNARARELAAALRMPCTACRASLRSHIGSGNRWLGCRKDGAR